jgi:probable DNA repair protein
MISLPAALEVVLRQGGAVVVPSRQRAHAVRQAHALAQLARGARAWPTPDVLPLAAWLSREVERHAGQDARLPRLLTPVQEWWLWRECALEATADLPLVNRTALAADLQSASHLATCHLIDMERWCAPPGTETSVLATVQRAVHARAREHGAGTLAQLLPLSPGIGSRGRLLFAGFVQPTPQLLALAAARPLEAGAAALTGSGEALGLPQVRVAPDEESELRHIAQWCREHLQADADTRLLVVLPGLPGRREQLTVLIRQALDPGGWLSDDTPRERVVIEGGRPLARASAVAHALTGLALLTGRRLAPAELSAWLLSPSWSHAAASRHPVVDRWLADTGALAWSFKELLAALPHAPRPVSGAARELARRLREAAVVLRNTCAGMRQWGERIKEALRVLGWPGALARDSAGEQTVVRFMELLEEAGSLEAMAGQMSRDSAVQCLTELAAHTAFGPAVEDALVTITPQLIDPVVTYDAIWVAGLTADCLPAPVQPDPYLPLAAQRAARVAAASAPGRLREAHALLAAWRAASADLTVSTPARSGDLALLPSPLLAEWPRREEPGHVALWLPEALRRDGQVETVEDAAGSTWPVDLPLPAGTRALDLMNQCPFRAYAELRLGAAERRVPHPGVASAVRGKLLHGAMQRFWSEVRDSQRLGALTDRALTGLIRRCVTASAKDLEAAQRPGMGGRRAFARERERAVRLIAQLCSLERARPPFTVEATELESHLTLGDRPLAVRIDRIDALATGGRAVLDYKSGRHTAADWHGARPSHPQLLAYLAAAGPDVVALATVNINARELRYAGMAQARDLLPGVTVVAPGPGMSEQGAWAAQRRAWLGGVNQLAAGFAAGQAPVEPRPGACERCHLAGLCRIAQGATVAGEDWQDPAALD